MVIAARSGIRPPRRRWRGNHHFGHLTWATAKDKRRSDNVRLPRWSSEAADEIATAWSLGSVAVVSDGPEPVPFEVYKPGGYLHGTKADLAVGEMLVWGRQSNFEEGRVMNYVYFTATLDAATRGARTRMLRRVLQRLGLPDAPQPAQPDHHRRRPRIQVAVIPSRIEAKPGRHRPGSARLGEHPAPTIPIGASTPAYRGSPYSAAFHLPRPSVESPVAVSIGGRRLEARQW